MSSSDASFPFESQSFVPSFFGGSGSGGWQFVVGGYTNWDGGVSGNAGTNLGTSSGPNWAPSWSPPSPGTYSFWVAKDGDSNYNPSNLAGPYTLTVTAAIPASQSAVSISPASATISTGQSVGFIASGGSGTAGYVWGGQASGTGSANTVTFNSAGTYSVTVYKAADSTYAQSNTATALVTVFDSTYSLTVDAGPGGTATGSAGGLAGNSSPTITATPNAGYGFVDWSGDPVANPGTATTTVPMNNANRTVTANFSALLQAQTIAFNPPATAAYPGPIVALTATATSGLPVSFTVASGPATLVGNQLTFTGTGTVIVQAAQGGGWNGGVDYQAAPSVNGTIQMNAPFTIIRLRFNSPAMIGGQSTGNMSLDANNVGHSASGGKQPSFIWTDPDGILSSPWPTFNNPGTLTPIQANVLLPLAPTASPGQSNVAPGGPAGGSP